MRIQLSNSIPTVVMLEDGQRAKAKLQAISVTGGLLQLRQALEEGGFVEVTFPTQSGPVHGMAEMLHPTRRSSDGFLQPFRFVAMEDDDHRTLRQAVDTTADRNFLGVSSSWSVPRSH